ncbi:MULTISPECIES: C40 family peptidase [unclassified Micromonospora]|uniref:C40 family peptidase n=1 Tax=unclassified Micromonospora TaxID=2617518 RepID=UPI003A8B8509
MARRSRGAAVGQRRDGARRQRRFVMVGAVPVRLSPALWAGLLGAVTAVALASPVYAQPATVPDTGSRPVPAGGLQLPGTGPTTNAPAITPTPVEGPLAAQIYAGETEVALLGQQLLELEQEQTAAETALAAAEQSLREARTALIEAQRDADIAASYALKDAAAMPPGEYRGDLHGLGALSRLQRGQQPGVGTDAANRDVSLAAAAEQEAYQTYTAALALVDALRSEFGSTEGTFKQRETALLALKEQNTEQLVAIERQREAAEQEIGQGIDGIDGAAAHPRAVAALEFALKQLGKPYLWGAEGPHRYDCSGLMWAAYRSPGADYFSLPRVAKDQYYATRHNKVDRSALLPGDLIFFASGSSWTTVHHVGMYVGNGKMVHAPTTGDVVKVSTVWWSRFYAATRVIREVAPTPSPTPTPTPTPSPTPSPTPTPTPTPSPDPSPDPSDSPSPDPTDSPSPDPSDSPSPSPSPSTSPSTPGPMPTPSDPSPSPTGSGTPDPDASGSGTPDPDASGSGTPTSTPSESSPASAGPSASATSAGTPSAGPLEG